MDDGRNIIFKILYFSNYLKPKSFDFGFILLKGDIIMLLKTLVENTSISSSFQHKHGICFYIEVENHKILFDLGSNEIGRAHV